MQQRHSLLLVALIFLHLTAISQEQKFVKKYDLALNGISKNHSIGTFHGGMAAYSGVSINIPGSRIYNPSFLMVQMGNSFPVPEAKSSIQPYQYFNPNRDLGIICQKEWKLEKSTGIPMRFRLGSLEYVDRMEGKSR